MEGAQIPFLAGKLRFHMPWGAAKKKRHVSLGCHPLASEPASQWESQVSLSEDPAVFNSTGK